MKLTRAAVYALLATIQLSESKAAPPLPCSKLAKLGRMPERFLLQILRTLVTRGILDSTRGVEGGYRLARPLSKITLLDLVEAVDGPLHCEAENVPNLAVPSQQRLSEVLDQISDDRRKRLASVTLANLKPAMC